MVMTRFDRENRRTLDGFVMDCPVCGAYLRWAHLEPSSHGSICTFCGATVVPTRPDGFRDLDERLVEVEDLGLIGEQLEDPPSLLEPIREPRRVPGWLLALVSIIAIVGFAAWRLTMSSPGEAAPAHAPSPAAPAAVPPASKGEPPPNVPHDITAVLHVDGRSWIAAMADGATRAYQMYDPPARLVFHAKHTLALTVGYPGGVRLEVDGKPVAFDTPNTMHVTVTLHGGHVSITQA